MANQVKSKGENPVMESDRRVGGNADLPPNALPGHCYARLLIPATYKTVTKRVLVQPAQTTLIATQAKYETQSERLLVRQTYTT